MVDILANNPFFLLFVMLAIFEVSVWVQSQLKRYHSGVARLMTMLVNPTLITTVGMIGFLMATDISWQTFEKASGYVMFWLQPAVVCLAVPFYIQWQKIRPQWQILIIAQLISSLVGIITGVWLVQLLGGSQILATAMAAKSVTTPIAIEVTDKLGGVMGITAATVLVAGVVGQMVGLGILALIKVKRPMALGLSMGAASHALGTVRIMTLGQRYVAYATVGLIMNGLLTAVIAPYVVPLMI